MKTIKRYLVRLASEQYLIRNGIWDECSGDPLNLEAEEFERRNPIQPFTPSTPEVASVPAQPETREQAEQRQRETMSKRFAGRAPTPATADFDLPAESDSVPAQAGQEVPVELVDAIVHTGRGYGNSETFRPQIESLLRHFWPAASVQPSVPAGYANETEFLRQQLKDSRTANKAAQLVIAGLQAQKPDIGRDAALVEYLIRYKHCMSYNDSYFGEPAGELKRMVYATDRAARAVLAAANK